MFKCNAYMLLLLREIEKSEPNQSRDDDRIELEYSVVFH